MLSGISLYLVMHRHIQYIVAILTLMKLLSTAELKSEMFSLGVVDGAIHCLKASSMAHVHFKSLEILRFLVQKQGR